MTPGAASEYDIPLLTFPKDVAELDYLFLACALNKSTYHLIDEKILAMLKKTCFVVNVSRGPANQSSASGRGIEK